MDAPAAVGEVREGGETLREFPDGHTLAPGIPAKPLTAETIEAAAWKAVLGKSELGPEWKSAIDVAALTGLGETFTRKTLKRKARAGEIESRIFNGFRDGRRLQGEFFKIDSSTLAQVLA